MKINAKTLIAMLLFTSGLITSGCALHYDENLGNKVSENTTAQVINPNAVNEQVPVATIEGQKAEALLSRYRKEEAEAPDEVLLKDIGSD